MATLSLWRGPPTEYPENVLATLRRAYARWAGTAPDGVLIQLEDVPPTDGLPPLALARVKAYSALPAEKTIADSGEPGEAAVLRVAAARRGERRDDSAVKMDEVMAVLRQEQIALMQNRQMQARDQFRQRVMVSALLPTHYCPRAAWRRTARSASPVRKPPITPRVTDNPDEQGHGLLPHYPPKVGAPLPGGAGYRSKACDPRGNRSNRLRTRCVGAQSAAPLGEACDGRRATTAPLSGSRPRGAAAGGRPIPGALFLARGRLRRGVAGRGRVGTGLPPGGAHRCDQRWHSRALGRLPAHRVCSCISCDVSHR